EAFNEYPEWRAKEQEDLVQKGAAFMSVVSSSPVLLKGVNPKRIAQFNKVAGKALSKFRQAIQSDKISWTVVAAASSAWAAKVFPDAPSDLQ
ncbi:aminopeptidase, partial [Alkalihalophilus pseudofirmus]